MRTHSTNKPTGGDAENTFLTRQHDRTGSELQFFDSQTVKAEQTTRGVRLHVKIPPTNGTDKRWQTPKKELDANKAVKKGTWVYISPASPIALTGMPDLVSGDLTKSPSGIWEAAQNVPAAALVASVLTYNVPQLPYPDASGAPSGDPLAGDLDGPNVFWIFISSVPICF